MKKPFYLSTISALLVILALTGCGGGGSSSGDESLNLTGIWEGYELDADNDGQTDEFPEEMFFLEIHDQSGALSGEFMALVNGEYYYSELVGNRTANTFSFTLVEDDYLADFSGFYDDTDGSPVMLAEWTDSEDDYGRVVFSRVEDVTDLDGDLLSAATSYWGNEYKLTHKFGQGTPVVFIHGANSNENIWNDMLKRLEAAGVGNHHSIYTYNYKWEDSVVDNARDLRTRIDQNGLQSPILIGGFTGGLIARQYIGAGGAFDRLITLGTPHMGGYLQSLYIPFFGWLIPSGMTDLAYNSNFMKGLLENPLDSEARSNYKAITGRLSGYQKRRCNAVFNTCWDEWVWSKRYNLYLIAANAIIKKSTQEKLGDKGSANDGLVTSFSANFGNCNDSACADERVVVSTICDHWGLFQPDGCPEAYTWIKGQLGR